MKHTNSHAKVLDDIYQLIYTKLWAFMFAAIYSYRMTTKNLNHIWKQYPKNPLDKGEMPGKRDTAQVSWNRNPTHPGDIWVRYGHLISQFV